MDKENMIQVEPYHNRFIPEYNHKSGMFLCTSGNAEVLINNSVSLVSR